MPKPTTTWFLIADGARARIVAEEAGQDVHPVFRHVFAAPTRAPGRAAASDRPGRSFDSAGYGRHAMEPEEDWHTRTERNFARMLAEELENGANARAFDRLILVAPPRMLGQLREALGKNAAARLAGEIGKDLTHIDDKHIGERLHEAMGG